MVFRSSQTGEVLCTMIVTYETAGQYKEVVKQIQAAGWNVVAIVSDGKKRLLG
jgi:hypothetical protein